MMEFNQRGFQVTSRDRVLREPSTALGRFLNVLAEHASQSDNPQQVIENGVSAIKKALDESAKPQA